MAVRRALREYEQRQRRKEAEDRLRNHINLLQLQQVVATAANEALSPEDAAQSVLDITRAYGQFTLAHLFYAADEDPVARPGERRSGRAIEEERHAAFREATESLDFAANSGVASMVLQQGGTGVDRGYLPTEPRFMRAGAAAAAGLRSVVMAPVAAGSETLGVIEFFGDGGDTRVMSTWRW